MRVAHFGTFDVANYGDLLFPLLLERRLGGAWDKVVHVSPRGGPPVFDDGVATVSVQAALARADEFDALIIGGGQLINAVVDTPQAYRTTPLMRATAYPGLWLGAAIAAAAGGGRLLWNGPGAPVPFTPGLALGVGWAADQSDSIALRSASTAEWFAQAGVTRPVHVIPDTAYDLPGLWTPEERAAALDALFARLGPRPERWLVVNYKRLGGAVEEPAAAAAAVAAMARALQAVPVFTAICDDDAGDLGALADGCDVPSLVLERPASLRELTALLAGAELYVGSSMHGMIAAAAFGRPALTVVPASVGPRWTKCREQSTDLDDARQVVPSWGAAAGALEARPPRSPDGGLAGTDEPQAAERAAPRLAEHWRRLEDELAVAASGRRADTHSALDALRALAQIRVPPTDLFTNVLAPAVSMLLHR